MSSARLILASRSPRRRELLPALGLAFGVRPADVDESLGGGDPEQVARAIALRKARAVADATAATDAVIGADTIVVHDGRMLGKPADADEAREMLRALRGRTHTVVSGVAVVYGGRDPSACVSARVTMRAYSDAEIARYIESGAPLDKAGAYAIQDAQFAPVERCEGCECAVIGLPLWTVRRLLRTVAGVEASAPSYDRCAACPLRSEVELREDPA